MASQGPLSAGAGAVDTSFGTRGWTSTEGNITASDNTRAVTQTLSSNSISFYLKSTTHGFTIPAGSTIDGIVVEIERSQSAAQNVRDSRVRIVKADGSIGTTARADTTTDWPTSDTIKTYGSSSDLWGETWAPADINDTDFGVALAATNSSATTATARVDHIRITVYYTAGGATVTGAAAVAGTGTVSASGTRTRLGVASVTGAGTVAATGTRTAIGIAAIVGTGGVNASGGVTRVGAGVISGSGSMSATAVRNALAAAGVAGTGSIAATATRTTFGVIAISGTGSISATAVGGQRDWTYTETPTSTYGGTVDFTFTTDEDWHYEPVTG